MTRRMILFAALLLVPAAYAQHEHGSRGDHDATVTHSFDNAAKWAAIFDDSTRAAWQKPAEVVRSLGLAPGQVVLDIGAGTGYFNRFFAEGVRPGGRVYAADIEPDMVGWMLERAIREDTPEVFPLLIPTDAPRVPEKVDVVFICDTWHHIDDRIAYARKIRSLLKPGGSVVVVDFRMGEIPVGPPEDHRLAPEKVTGEMESAGLRLERRDDNLLPYQYVLSFIGSF